MKKEFTEQPNYLSKVYIEHFCKTNDISLPVIIEKKDNLIIGTDAKNKKIKFNSEAGKFISQKLNSYRADRAKILPEYCIIYEINF